MSSRGGPVDLTQRCSLSPVDDLSFAAEGGQRMTAFIIASLKTTTPPHLMLCRVSWPARDSPVDRSRGRHRALAAPFPLPSCPYPCGRRPSPFSAVRQTPTATCPAHRLARIGVLPILLMASPVRFSAAPPRSPTPLFPACTVYASPSTLQPKTRKE